MNVNFSHPLVLDNGLVLFMKDIPNSDVVNIHARVLMGTCDEKLPRDKGVCSLIEGMAWRGTQDFSGDRIATICGRYPGTIGGNVQYAHTDYIAQVPPEDLDEMMFLLDSIIFRMDMDVGDLETEKRIAESRMVTENSDPATYATQSNLSTLFPDHNVAFGIRGNAKTIQGMTITRMREFVRNFHRPQTVMLGLAGSLLSFSDMEVMLDENAKGFVRKTRAANQMPLARDWGNPDHIDEWVNVTNEWGDCGRCTQVITLPFPLSGQAVEDKIMLDVLAELFGGSPASIIPKRLQAADGIAHNVSVQSNMLRNIAWMHIVVDTMSDSADKTKGAVLESINDVADGNVGVQDVNRSVNMVDKKMSAIKTSPADTLTHLLNAHCLDIEPDEYDAAISKTSTSDVKRIMSEICNLDAGVTHNVHL